MLYRKWRIKHINNYAHKTNNYFIVILRHRAKFATDYLSPKNVPVLSRSSACLEPFELVFSFLNSELFDFKSKM